MAKRACPWGPEFRNQPSGMAVRTSDFSIAEAEMGKSLALTGQSASSLTLLKDIRMQSSYGVEHRLFSGFHSAGV